LRAAAVLVSVGKDVAREIVTHLDEAQVRRLAEAARYLKRTDPDTLDESLSAFITSLEGVSADLIAGDGLLREVTSEILGEETARRVFDGVAPPPAADEALGPVAMADPEALATVLGREQPQTIALVLGALEPDRACEVMEHLPEEKRPEVIRRLALVEAVSPEVLRQVGAALASELRAVMAGGVRRLEGRAAALEMLRRSPQETQDEVIEAIAAVNAELADELKQSLFTFEDLSLLTDRDIQALLKEVESQTLVTALKGASPELRDKILGNMSSRAADLVRDDLEAMGPLRLAVVERAQKEIAEIALNLASEDRITIVRPSDEMV
jgi:flagellar motor switch protein FliG